VSVVPPRSAGPSGCADPFRALDERGPEERRDGSSPESRGAAARMRLSQLVAKQLAHVLTESLAKRAREEQHEDRERSL
jgi:hypothetical protein